ncbi:hypothetical protein Pyrfu_0324 [Pyrolobus fumarii 1A]|uniref:Integrase SSV1 C-terminal domain-containing protein n=1 Tax=Pyrolobus fumarii (strain DSM 11204 / 1A) TaxID=694429 RepID=G0EFM5_PYRF1|nr:integrase [Pyrolobus fumarii]AEM38196.1 hypothetical protein Pyrfu_0324 [Pyrolobus fumarii 1A]
MRFEEYIRKTAPLSYRDYMRYWEGYHSIIESLGFERLPCNKWVLKLASKWLSWAASEGRISLEEEARARRLLALKRLACGRVIEGRRGEGWERCEDWGRVELDEKEWAQTLQQAVLWSGSRLKHLWLLPRFTSKRRIAAGLAVYDLKATIGRKRVNVIILPVDLEERLLRVVKEYSYESRREIKGTPATCLRKIHYELCLATASGEEELLCSFLHGRHRPVSVKHYMMYVAHSVRKTLEMKPGIEALLNGSTIEEAIEKILASRRASTGVDRAPVDNQHEPTTNVYDVEGEAVATPQAKQLDNINGQGYNVLLLAARLYLDLNPRITR